MFKELLRRKATIAEWEAERLIHGIPFGFCNREWEDLKAKMQPGDEIWFWSSDPEDWQRLRGWEGMALVRDGVIVESFLTGIN